LTAGPAGPTGRPCTTGAGRHLPPGATPDQGGVNFSLFARDAAAAELRLYERAASDEPFQVIGLDPEVHRTFFFWHVYVEGLRPGVHYTWRVARPGQALHAEPELLDPWARSVSDARWNRRAAGEGATGNSLRAIVTAGGPPRPGPRPPARELSDAVIYEVHVGGFTRHPSAGVRHPGTFSALQEKIPYLKELGVTHVELLPVMAFDEQDVPPEVSARGLKNFWGYSSCGFYAPHSRYCVDPADAPREFQDCVRVLHAAGIGVLLDVVFNHTAEGGAAGPTIHFKAIANDVFYHRDAGGGYRDYTGCGNTVNCNHPLVASFIVNCLEYWADEMGVDGFRFDLASVFARGQDGEVLADPPLPWMIELSRPLIERPLIAEAWDAAGLYHVGAFPGMRWAEWNGRYRDVMRRFVRGEPGITGEVATRLAGSSDLFADDQRSPASSVNFITCHDGFTLADLVAYGEKHNEANGEDNRDGTGDNLSWNCGAEGETDDPEVLALRRRQAKNFMALLFLSQGVPMILAGDEVLRSQRGNNNAYCQDNALSWFDWRLAEANRDMLRFVRELIALRKRHPSLRRSRFLRGRPKPGQSRPDIAWHGERLDEPPWHDGGARTLAFTLAGIASGEGPLHVVLNMSDAGLEVSLPDLPGFRWRRALDTALASPRDVTPPEEQAAVESDRYLAQPRSVVVLEGW
jgi:glycogen operon protein